MHLVQIIHFQSQFLCITTISLVEHVIVNSRFQNYPKGVNGTYIKPVELVALPVELVELPVVPLQLVANIDMAHHNVN